MVCIDLRTSNVFGRPVASTPAIILALASRGFVRSRNIQLLHRQVAVEVQIAPRFFLPFRVVRDGVVVLSQDKHVAFTVECIVAHLDHNFGEGNVDSIRDEMGCCSYVGKDFFIFQLKDKAYSIRLVQKGGFLNILCVFL